MLALLTADAATMAPTLAPGLTRTSHRPRRYGLEMRELAALIRGLRADARRLVSLV
jgi:hypothetical protein